MGAVVASNGSLWQTKRGVRGLAARADNAGSLCILHPSLMQSPKNWITVTVR